MWQVVVLTLSLVVTANSYTSRQPRSYSAASEAQIRFANENKYDDTGPGAKGREFAYKTYGTLEEALLNYLDDPNTTLPEHEREKALNFLKLQNANVYRSHKRPFPNTVGEYNAYTKQAVPVVPLSLPTKQTFLDSDNSYGLLDLKGFQLNDIPASYQKDRVNDGYSYQKIQSLKGAPVSVAHYTRGFQGHHQKATVDDQFDPNPQYSFSYGVNDKRTGDTKSAQETRADGIVRGFYSFLDADGRQRTVHYTADDKQGFQAKVQRTLRDTAQ